MTTHKHWNDLSAISTATRSTAYSMNNTKQGVPSSRPPRSNSPTRALLTRRACAISARFTRCVCRSSEAGRRRAWREAFEQTYRAEFGNTLGNIEAIVVSLETAVSALPPARARREAVEASQRRATPCSSRPVHFGGWTDTAIYRRSELFPGMCFDGPAVVEQADATTVIEPSMKVHVDAFGNLLVRES